MGCGVFLLICLVVVGLCAIGMLILRRYIPDRE